MIHHLSIAAREPENVAAVFAEIFGGIYIPFRPNRGSFMVFQLDDVGTEIEIHPLGTQLTPDDPGFVTDGAPGEGRTATHFALSVAASEEKILEIAAAQGWLCRRTQRAEFPLVELWIENAALCELLPPDCAAQYLEVNRVMKAKVLQERANAAGRQA